MTSLATTLGSPLRHVPTDTTALVNAAPMRIAGSHRHQRAFAPIAATMRAPEQAPVGTAIMVVGQVPPRHEIDPDERRWQLEWERRNIED